MKAGAHPALAQGKVRYVGDHVAVVIADTYAQARDAAEKIEVDYTELPAVVDPAKAARPGQPQIHDAAPNNTVYNWHLGDKAATDAAFASRGACDETRFRQQPADPERDGAARRDRRIRFGHRHAHALHDEPEPACGAARAVGVHRARAGAQVPRHRARRRRRLRLEDLHLRRGDGLRLGGQKDRSAGQMDRGAHRGVPRPTRTAAITSRMPNWRSTRAARSPGCACTRPPISALSVHVRIDRCRPILYAPLLSGQYDIPNIYAEVDGVYTNTAPVDAYRGAGRPEATFVVERLVEVAARETGRDPAEFRRMNFVTTFPHQTPVVMAYDVGDYPAALDKAMALADYKGVGARKAASAAKGKLRGIGFSAYIEACGARAVASRSARWAAASGLWESAEIRVNPIGTVEVLTGSHSHGQGHETTFAQLVSSRLGIPIENVSIIHGDTDKVQFGMGTYGSRSGAVGMAAISKALDKVEAKAKKIAGHVLEASEGDIEFKEGKFTVKGTDKSIDFGSVALNAYTAHKFNGQEIEPGLKESAFWDPTNFTFPAGVHICELEIDPQTGVVTIDRWTAVDDFGKLINPMIVEGQVHGGIAQGVGQALLEGAHYDDDGQLLTASYMDYCMPRADDLPSFNVETIETPCPSNPLGIKGCGEAGAIASPPAVINAITDALGHEDVAMPATPQVVWRAAQKSAAKLAAE